MGQMPQMSEDARRRLGRGEAIIDVLSTGGASGMEVRLQAVIEAPPERVWKLVDNSAGYSNFMPRLKTSRELSRDGEDVRLFVEVDMPFPMKNLKSTTQARHIVGEEEGRYTRSWTLVEGDYDRNEGSWELAPFDGDMTRTWLVYNLTAKPKVKMPSKLQAMAQRKALPKIVEAIRKNV